MTILIVIFSIIVLATLLFKNEIGLAAYLFFLCVVPLQGLYFGGFFIGLNAILLLIFVLGFVNYKQTDTNKIELLYPFLALIVFQGLLIPFNNSNEPLSFQIDMFRIDLFKLIFPYVIIRAASNSPKVCKYLDAALYSAIIINCLYGVYLTFNIGQNPYLSELSTISQINDEGDQSAIIAEGLRRFGYIHACFSSVTSYGLFLLLSFVYVLRDFMFAEKRKRIVAVVLALIVINIIICGSRSVLYSLVVTIGVYLLLNGHFKYFLYSSIAIILSVVIISVMFPELYDFFMSFNDSSIMGSSSEMRIDQFKGCIEELKNNPLTGNGYQWTSWYLSNFDTHPTMIAFESIIIQILCNGGLIGLGIWIAFIIKYTINIREKINIMDEHVYYYMLIAAFFVRSLLTGDYGGFSLFIIVFALMIICTIEPNKD